MYKSKIFNEIEDLTEYLNENKIIDSPSIAYDGFSYILLYWEEEPQPQQKDLIPESDKTNDHESWHPAF